MKYRVVGLEMRHVAVDVDAETKDEAAQKGYQLFVKDDDSVELTCDDSHYDEEVEVSPYNDDDNYDPAAFEIVRGIVK